MQNKLLTLLCATAALVATGARAQDTTVATPSTPAPAVQQAAPQQQATPAAPQQPAQVAAQAQVAPAPNQIIYSPRLPSPQELTSAAQAQGQSVEQIIQTSNQITVVYRSPSGQLNTVAYQLLPTPGSMATATVVTPAPTVVYQTAPRTVYYRSYDPFWDDDYWYPPVSLNFGFGYYHGWGGGGYRGGWHGGGHHWR